MATNAENRKKLYQAMVLICQARADQARDGNIFDDLASAAAILSRVWATFSTMAWLEEASDE